MPYLDHKGPIDKAPKTGRKLGLCNKEIEDDKEMGVIGEGQGKRRHSGGGNGKGKRLKYNLRNNK